MDDTPESVEVPEHLFASLDKVWTFGEKQPYLSPSAYLDLVLVVVSLHRGDGEDEIRVSNIYELLSAEAEAEVTSIKGQLPHLVSSSGPLLSDPDILSARRTQRGGPRFSIGPTAEALNAERKRTDATPSAFAEALQHVRTTGSLTQLERLYAKTDTQAQTRTRTRAGTGAGDGTTTTTHGHRPEAPAIVFVSGRDGREREIRLQGVSAANKGRFEGLSRVPEIVTGCELGVTGCELGVTGCELSGGEPAARFRLRLLPGDKIESLLGRSPLGSYPRNAVPAELYEAATDWRPILAESKPLAALFQYNLMAFWRDEDYTYDGDCSNIPLPYDKILAAFGLTKDSAYAQGVTTGMLLELYRAYVDPLLDWTDWHPSAQKARVIKRHGIPTSIIELRKAMLGPGDIDDRRELITGKVASKRRWSAPVNKARQDEIDEQEPVIEPPAATKRIQSYLNSIEVQYFAHGAHGNLRGDVIDEAIREVRRSIDEEQRRDQERVKLHWMRCFPQPLYAVCDRFPRLKADYYNQAMNLPSRILRSTYTENDYELDLSKAHLASYVPVARREGLEVPVLEEYLQANLEGDEELLEGGDLWTDLASTLEVSNAQAARKAVKRAYSAVYGSSRQNLLHQIYQEYGKLTGTYLDGHDPLRPLLDHPLMEELLSTRDKLEAIITSRGGLEDATGRLIPLSAWDETKDTEDRWRGVMAYVNASYEQEIMAAAFDVAQEEMDADGRTDMTIWLYQADGFTVRMRSRVSHSKRIEMLQDAVAERAAELGVPTELEVDYAGS
jgi:hypothetical protein